MQGRRGVRVDAELVGLHREYLFRKTFGGSHADYVDELAENVDWLLLIHAKELDAEVELAKNAQAKAKRRS